MHSEPASPDVRNAQAAKGMSRHWPLSRAPGSRSTTFTERNLMTRKRVVLFACLSSLVAAAGIVHKTTATERAPRQRAAPVVDRSSETMEAALQSSDPLAFASLLALAPSSSSSSSSSFVESQDAVDCAAGGWQPATSGWPPGRCCGSTRHWIKFTGGANHIDKCCGACPE